MSIRKFNKDSHVREYGRILLPDFMDRVDRLKDIVIEIHSFFAPFVHTEILHFKGNKVIRILFDIAHIIFSDDLEKDIFNVLDVEDLDLNGVEKKIKNLVFLELEKSGKNIKLWNESRDCLELGKVQALNRKSFLKKLQDSHIEKWHANYERCDMCDGMAWEMKFWFAERKSPVTYEGVNYWPDTITLFSKLFEKEKRF